MVHLGAEQRAGKHETSNCHTLFSHVSENFLHVGAAPVAIFNDLETLMVKARFACTRSEGFEVQKKETVRLSTLHSHQVCSEERPAVMSVVAFGSDGIITGRLL